MQMLLNGENMLIEYISVFSIICVKLAVSYNNRLYTLTSYENISESQCGQNTANALWIEKRVKDVKDKSGKGGATIAPWSSGLGWAITTTQATDPLIKFETILNEVLYGPNLDVKPSDHTEVTPDNDGHDKQMHYPTGQFMRAETFNDKGSVHLPFLEYIHRGHCRLKITQDYMQTAVDAFAILVAGDLSDVERLPGSYVLQSARTISMMRIQREKLAAMWDVVKGDTRTENVSYETLEKFRPLFKYVNGREIARLNLSDSKILMYVGTHPDLSRHQVGVVASKYISLNPHWRQAKYLNMMNNLLCGVPMNLMRRVPQNTFLQLTHQIFYHIRACDAIKRQFYLNMMMRTQALGKSYSWSAREVSRLGLLLTAVSGQNLSAVKPEAMAGITARVMLEMPVDSLRGITAMQLRHLDPKSLNILARKLITSQTISAACNPSAELFKSSLILLIYISIVILVVFEII